ncbi:MAG: VTT domain-containing protein [Nanoarchaeota archaeon]
MKFIKSFLSLFLIVFLFVFVSYIVQTNFVNLESYISKNYYWALIFIILEIFATVAAPVSAVPLIPIFSNIYGWFITGLLSIIGWTIGSVISFFLARKYGVPLVNKLVNLDKVHKLEKNIPDEHLFLSIVILRMILPVDILSYALGLFSKVKFGTYFWATLIGIIPFAFIWAYVGILPIYYQINIIVTTILIIILIFLVYKKKKII